MSNILVAAPHPDDETFGCGGTLLRHRRRGDRLDWLLFTEMREEYGYNSAAVSVRRTEIASVAQRFGFTDVHQLGFAPTGLDALPLSRIVDGVARVFAAVQPEIVYVPFRGDAHSDHKAAFDALAACTKWFRYPSVNRVLAYEVLSETDAALGAIKLPFVPTVFSDIASELDEKIAIMQLYASECAPFPFPRSETALRALAQVRGVAAGFAAAEAFMLLRERIA